MESWCGRNDTTVSGKSLAGGPSVVITPRARSQVAVLVEAKKIHHVPAVGQVPGSVISFPTDRNTNADQHVRMDSRQPWRYRGGAGLAWRGNIDQRGGFGGKQPDHLDPDHPSGRIGVYSPDRFAALVAGSRKVEEMAQAVVADQAIDERQREFPARAIQVRLSGRHPALAFRDRHASPRPFLPVKRRGNLFDGCLIPSKIGLDKKADE